MIRSERKPPTVFITIDTEEDDWGDYTSPSLSTSNASLLLEAQDLFEEFGARPTYLVDFPMVTIEPARSIIREIFSRPCEIGAHCHPWNTPPVKEELNSRNSMMANLPPTLVVEKLHVLNESIGDCVGKAPTSFRAGRWGFGKGVAEALVQLEYEVDSSVSPFVDWSLQFGPDYRSAPHFPYWFRPEAPLQPCIDGPLLQVPTTVGFFQKSQRRAQRVRETVKSVVPSSFRALGILDRLGINNLRWLSPETSTAVEMIRLAKNLVLMGIPSLNFTFHSPTMTPALTPFVRTKSEQEDFFRRIESFLAFAKEEGMRFATLSEAPGISGLTTTTQ